MVIPQPFRQGYAGVLFSPFVITTQQKAEENVAGSFSPFSAVFLSHGGENNETRAKMFGEKDFAQGLRFFHVSG
ncbi:Hypothetical protein NTJ_13366 [Nesidiocoris tenuis]|uniref:Uncharacterized protein n=1 Tax=Nesidiocoris tenuis TaxID=355587 RepID=A0ABN7B9R4_9HEMI|nr:Hypothetical protein NTJ_13366 [Nesidiocoris tenuis]